ncbi:MAG: helix-turn-helix domain-containing protein [Chitinophagaceae bacterium]
MNPSNVQVQFFRHLKTQLPAHISMVDEVAELLSISTDSAYRRIRGEKPMDLEETHKLCSHFKISVDQILHLETDAFIFKGKLNPGGAEYAIEDWLQDVQHQFELINSFEKKHIYYLMKDIPPFVHFQLPELTAFRCFFYMKSILQDERLKGIKFALDDSRYDKYIEQSKKIIALYNQVSITEIWNIETLNSTLNQINFYAEAEAFANKNDVRVLYGKVEELINHIEKQAELGVQFKIGSMPTTHAAEYRMFVNELILGNNTFFAEIGDSKITYLNHSVLYFISTRDERFNNAMSGNLQNLMKKSTMISAIGEKDRARFFNRLRNKIHDSIAKLP